MPLGESKIDEGLGAMRNVANKAGILGVGAIEVYPHRTEWDDGDIFTAHFVVAGSRLNPLPISEHKHEATLALAHYEFSQDPFNKSGVVGKWVSVKVALLQNNDLEELICIVVFSGTGTLEQHIAIVEAGVEVLMGR
jgi:hypothetical protein